MNNIAIIQARMNSARLPGKVLMELGEKVVLDWVVRAATSIPGIDEVVVATTSNSSDNPIEEWCANNDVKVYRGSEEDVLGRFAAVIKQEKPARVVRLTADCPMLDPQICGLVLERLIQSTSAYACNFEPRSWPDGLDCEAVTAEALLHADREAEKAFDREHVTTYIRARRHRFGLEQVSCPLPGIMDERWTLDTPQDLAFLENLVTLLPDGDQPPAWLEVHKCLLANQLSQNNHQPARQTQATPQSAVTIEPLELRRSQRLFERAIKAVPLGTQTYSKSFMQYPHEAPRFVMNGDGARVWDVDGNEYIDLVSGLLPVVLGYRDPDVDDAVRRQLNAGVSFSLSTELEVELAEMLIELVPCADMVRFGKNGSDATSAAVRLARASTGRDRIAACGYHGWQDWYIGSTVRNKGVPKAVSDLTDFFPFNDLEALERVLAAHRNEFAAIVMEPVGFLEPEPGYLANVKKLAHQHGALLIFDEIITGFRVSLGGAQTYYNVVPDLACFGKAMANGLPISAVMGPAHLMAGFEDVFFSGTFGGETLSLAAAIATIRKMQKEEVIDSLWSTGRELSDLAEEEISSAGLANTISFGGLPVWRVLSFSDHPGGSKEAIQTVFVREMLKAGVLLLASHNVTYAHDKRDLGHLRSAYRLVMKSIFEELEVGDLDRRLGDDVIRPAFSVRKRD